MFDTGLSLFKAIAIVAGVITSGYSGQPLSDQDKTSIRVSVSQLKDAILREDIMAYSRSSVSRLA